MKLTKTGYEALGEMLNVIGRLRQRLLDDIPAADIRGNLGFLSLLLERIEGGLVLPEED
jgi:hypothetical protein